MFKGSITALITPFTENGDVDYKAFEKFVDWQIKQGTHGLVPVGTTGESPTLSHEEHKRVVQTCIDVAAGRVPVIAGAGSNSTREAIDFALYAEQAGADAVLVVTPYYNKPSQEGLYQHFKAINDAISIPIIMYNIPGRSVIDMTDETMKRLFTDCENIIGVKDATGDLARPTWARQIMGPEFLQFSGEDATALAFNAMGGIGAISVTSNIAPALCAAFQEATLAGDYTKALELQDKLLPLHDAMFMEPSPAGPKFAAEILGLCNRRVRMPLQPLTTARQKLLSELIENLDLPSASS
ncbi:4-hydroxy-tetrahydrodipicolinate synthase [Temperatibacter marinus]|uniref:4-hydroxy-tetrahydrodipicolinate synthase n=1 Tax=Temperatibacter marinus TaxID=1456591 RepID=A0AA52EHK3_9PROT|nr:4-hydroxy-tetrahydrodipicolinate synthase [Temperatibacter marinus]WND02444.1 4-hydroxy-tetrahydrodipicolinate synthase [Temperatibacter marinus]